MRPVHNLPPYFPNIHFNIIFPSMSTSSERSLPFRFSNQNIACISHLSPHSCYMLSPSNPPWCDNLSNISWNVQVTKLLIMRLPHPPATSSFLGPNIFLSTLFSNTLNLCSSLSAETKFHTPKIHSNVLLPSMPRSSEKCLPFRF